MTSITMPRKRCRVKSVNWKVFGWLLMHEATLQLEGARYFATTERGSRQLLATATLSDLMCLYPDLAAWRRQQKES